MKALTDTVEYISNIVGLFFTNYPILSKILALILYILALVFFLWFAIKKIKDDINDGLAMVAVIFSVILSIFVLYLGFNVVIGLVEVVKNQF